MKNRKKKSKHEEVKELHYNMGLSYKELAFRFGKSERTIYRWLKGANQEESLVSHNSQIGHIQSHIHQKSQIMS